MMLAYMGVLCRMLLARAEASEDDGWVPVEDGPGLTDSADAGAPGRFWDRFSVSLGSGIGSIQKNGFSAFDILDGDYDPGAGSNNNRLQGKFTLVPPLVGPTLNLGYAVSRAFRLGVQGDAFINEPMAVYSGPVHVTWLPVNTYRWEVGITGKGGFAFGQAKVGALYAVDGNRAVSWSSRSFEAGDSITVDMAAPMASVGVSPAVRLFGRLHLVGYAGYAVLAARSSDVLINNRYLPDYPDDRVVTAGTSNPEAVGGTGIEKGGLSGEFLLRYGF